MNDPWPSPASRRTDARSSSPSWTRSFRPSWVWSWLGVGVRSSAGSWGGWRAVVGRPSRRAVGADVLLWVVMAFPVVAGTLLPVRLTAAWWAQVAGLALVAVAVVVSRSGPSVALLLMAAALPLHGNFVFGFPVMAYLAGRRTGAVRPVLWIFAAMVVGGATLNLLRGVSVTQWFPLTVWLVLLGVLPWLAGRYWRQYQQLVHAGWQRAVQLEREQRIVAERERLRERARIAREMHDSLGHELALIAVRAGALQVAPGLEERHRRAAAELRAGAAAATTRLREIIGVLREDDGRQAAGPQEARQGEAAGAGVAAPVPARSVGDSVAALVERARDSGVLITLGEVAPVGPVAPMVALAVHRVVQEAITNAVKHAPGAAVTVEVTTARGGQSGPDSPREGGVVRVRVVNGPGGRPLLGGGGHGLTGLAERVRVAGGRLRAGPTAEGGFQVSADLPLRPSPAPAAPHEVRPGSRPDAAPGPLLDGDFPGGLPEADTRSTVGAVAGSAAGGGGPMAPVSESALRWEHEQRRLRRGLTNVIMVPAGLLAALATVMAGYHVHVTMNSVLRPADFGALRVGEERARVERVLPYRQLPSSVVQQVPAAEPPGARCRYYRPDANVLGLGMVYRLCFTGDRLSHKDAYRISSVESPAGEGRGR